MLTATTIFIAQRWKSTEVPTLGEWFSKVWYMCLLNKLSAMSRMGYVNAVKNIYAIMRVIFNV